MVQLVIASGKSICRGHTKKCLFKDWNRRGIQHKIAKGSRALQISVYGAGGGATAFYCDECMKPILELFKNILEEINK